jgi:hypothetical protein
MAFSQVMQIPLMKPVYYREKKSKLYSATAYFLAAIFCSTITLFFYPFSVGLLSYHFLGFDNNSFK